MKISLLALDLDGTLINSSGGISQAAKEVIRQVTRKRIKVVICTGRRFRTALKDVLSLNIDCPLIVHNGVLTKEIKTGQTLYSNLLGREIYGEIQSFMSEISQHPLVYVDSYNEGVDFFANELKLSHPFQVEYVFDNLPFCGMGSEPESNHLNKLVMVSLMAEEDFLTTLELKARERFSERLSIQVLKNIKYKGSILELFSPQASKWKSLLQLAESYGLSSGEIMAIGDDLNDLDMIKHCALGIAMGNACEEIKKAAYYVTNNNDNDGVAQAIEKYLLS